MLVATNLPHGLTIRQTHNVAHQYEYGVLGWLDFPVADSRGRVDNQPLTNRRTQKKIISGSKGNLCL